MTAETAAQTVSVLRTLFEALRADLLATPRRDIVIAAILGAAVFLLSCYRLEATRLAIEVNNCIFGADAVTYREALAEGSWLGLRVHKHALAVLVVAVLAQPLAWLGLPAASAGTIALALVQGLAAMLIYVFMRRSGQPPLASLALSVLAMAGLGVATHFGIAETYGVTVAAIAGACILFPLLASVAAERLLPCALVAGAVVAMLAVANAPATAFVLVYAACLFRLLGPGRMGAALIFGLVIPFAIGAVAVVAPALVAEGTGGATWHNAYLARYSDLGNFANGRILLDYVASTLVFAFVAPMEFLRCRFVVGDLAVMLVRPLHLAAYLSTAGVLIFGIVRSLRSAAAPISLGLLGAAGAILAFYLYFNPDEALLYSPQWTVALVFAAAPELARASLWAGVAAALSLVVNVPALHDPRSTDPQICCPNPPGTMLPREMPRVHAARAEAQAAAGSVTDSMMEQ